MTCPPLHYVTAGPEDTNTTTTSSSENTSKTTSPEGSSLATPPNPYAETCSCSTTSLLVVSAITAASTALLATVIFVLIQVAVCRRFLARIGSKTSVAASAAAAAAVVSPREREDGVYDQIKKEDRDYDQVLNVHYSVPSGGLSCGGPRPHYDTPRRSAENGDHTYMAGDHAYMAVGGRVLITATNRMATGGDCIDGRGVAVGGVAPGEGSLSSNSECNLDHTYMTIDSSRKDIMVKQNEAYEAIDKNTSHR